MPIRWSRFRPGGRPSLREPEVCSVRTVSTPAVIPETPSPRIIHWFGGWIERMLRRDFHAVRLVRGSGAALAELNTDRSPLIVLMNHPSWWDPLTGMYLARRLTPARPMFAPMEAEQLAKFSFFRKLGVFGIDPDRPDSVAALSEHVLERFAREPWRGFWLTPQGEFTDPRQPVRLRPGAAAIAAKLPSVRCVCVACELVFWSDRRPELLLNVRRVPEDASRAGSTLAWTRAMTEGLAGAMAELSELSIARDPGAFEVLLGKEEGQINPLYDLWLRLTGRTGTINAKRRDKRRGRIGGASTQSGAADEAPSVSAGSATGGGGGNA